MGRVKIGLDYWNVCSHHEGYFRRLATLHLVAGDKVHVVSAVGPQARGKRRPGDRRPRDPGHRSARGAGILALRVTRAERRGDLEAERA